MKKMLTAKDAAEILEMTSGGARDVLGPHHDKITLPSGHVTRVWSESHVLRLRDIRKTFGKKPREKVKKPLRDYETEFKPGKSFDFEVNEFGKVVPPKRCFRGRTCRYEGCPVPVPTGKLYCDDHSDHFKQMQKTVANHATISYPSPLKVYRG